MYFKVFFQKSVGLLANNNYCKLTSLNILYKNYSKNVLPLFLKSLEFQNRPAILDENGLHTYDIILSKSLQLADKIQPQLNLHNKESIGSRICVILPNDVSFVISMFATWLCEAVFVPLSIHYPDSQMKYFFDDSNARLIVTNEEYSVKIKNIFNSQYKRDLFILNEKEYVTRPQNESELNTKLNRFKQLYSANKFKDVPSVIVYTSGTTNLPKGVVHTFGSLQSQMAGMVEAWRWSRHDVILHSLPLHHVHGLINALMTPLFCGALCYILPSFDAKKIWSSILGSSNIISPRPVNLFMGVPTMYSKLINELQDYSFKHKLLKNFIKESCFNKIRLFVSGSAPLPLNILLNWEELTGHVLLERYGMTEAGMILTNPLEGARRPGFVGMPLKNVEVRIVRRDASVKEGYKVLCSANSKQCSIHAENESLEGELHVRGLNLFSEYLNKPNETKQAFTQDAWFITGDTAAFRDGSFKILGRTSVDIIKSGGFKISALEVEHCLIKHELISEVAVIGLPDPTWGQKIAAVIVLKTETSSILTLKELQEWAKQSLAKHQIPTSIKLVEKIDKNNMGKIDKKKLATHFTNFNS